MKRPRFRGANITDYQSSFSTGQSDGGSPKSGTSIRMPPCIADWCATKPGRLKRAACQMFVGDSNPVAIDWQKSSTMK